MAVLAEELVLVIRAIWGLEGSIFLALIPHDHPRTIFWTPMATFFFASVLRRFIFLWATAPDPRSARWGTTGTGTAVLLLLLLAFGFWLI
jgi:hypothetical protein